MERRLPGSNGNHAITDYLLTSVTAILIQNMLADNEAVIMGTAIYDVAK